MCFGLPVIWLALRALTESISDRDQFSDLPTEYVFHVNDYVIIEDFGCNDEWYPSFAVFAILFIPPLVLSAGTICLGGGNDFPRSSCPHANLHIVQLSVFTISSPAELPKL
jgi:hypothetical protein